MPGKNYQLLDSVQNSCRFDVDQAVLTAKTSNSTWPRRCYPGIRERVIVLVKTSHEVDRFGEDNPRPQRLIHAHQPVTLLLATISGRSSLRLDVASSYAFACRPLVSANGGPHRPLSTRRRCTSRCASTGDSLAPPVLVLTRPDLSFRWS